MGPPPNGTIFIEPSKKTIVDSDYPEFFNLPLKRCNEMMVCVKGNQGAQIALYNGTFDSSTTKPIIITFGANKNTNSTITVHGDSVEKAHTDTKEKKGLISPNVYVAYRIEWNRNLIRVMNESDEAVDSFMWFRSPTLVEVDMFGIRSVGSNVSWLCQGGKRVDTVDGQDFQHFQVVTGRLEFEIKAVSDVHLALCPTPKGEAPLYSFLIGTPGPEKLSLYYNGKEVASGEFKAGIADDDFLGIWLKWDAEKLTIGKLKFDPASITYKPTDGPLPRLNYFGINSANGSCSFWKIAMIYSKDDFDDYIAANGTASPKKKASWEK